MFKEELFLDDAVSQGKEADCREGNRKAPFLIAFAFARDGHLPTAITSSVILAQNRSYSVDLAYDCVSVLILKSLSYNIVVSEL